MFKNRWLQSNSGGSGEGTNQGGTGGSQGAGQGTGQQQGQGQQSSVTFDAWLDKQDVTVKGLLNDHIKGLKTALDSERASRKDMERQLRDLAKKADDGSEAQEKLTRMADEISAADRRADFYEEAHRAGVANLKLAFIVATQDDLFDSKNRVNFDGMKKSYPELFAGTKIPDGNAGNGTGSLDAGKNDMNSRIRGASGRQP